MADYYNPYRNFSPDSGSWIKAQFHCHPTGMDGSGAKTESLDYFGEILDEYKAADYQLVGQTPARAWFDSSSLGREHGIRTFNGQEYVRWDGIILMGTKHFYDGDPQGAIDSCLSDGGFAIICHPNQNPALSNIPGIPPVLTREMSHALIGPVGVEIYNGCLAHHQINGVPCGASLATDYWDDALSSGRRLWGFGADDSHHRHEINVGWTEIFAPDDEFETVKSAIEMGTIVASRGMRLYRYDFDGVRLEVEADLPYQRAGSASYRFVAEGGRILKEETARYSTYRLRGDEMYVRVEVRGEDGSVLWTQPLLRADSFALPEQSPRRT